LDGDTGASKAWGASKDFRIYEDGSGKGDRIHKVNLRSMVRRSSGGRWPRMIFDVEFFPAFAGRADACHRGCGTRLRVDFGFLMKEGKVWEAGRRGNDFGFLMFDV